LKAELEETLPSLAPEHRLKARGLIGQIEETIGARLRAGRDGPHGSAGRGSGSRVSC
jgi:hypothetical protein